MRYRILPLGFMVLFVVGCWIKLTQPHTSEILQVRDVSVFEQAGTMYIQPEVFAMRTFRGQYWTQLQNTDTGRDVYPPKWSASRTYHEGRRYREIERLTWWTDQPILDLVPNQHYELKTCYRAVLNAGRYGEPTCIKPVEFTAPLTSPVSTRDEGAK